MGIYINDKAKCTTYIPGRFYVGDEVEVTHYEWHTSTVIVKKEYSGAQYVLTIDELNNHFEKIDKLEAKNTNTCLHVWKHYKSIWIQKEFEYCEICDLKRNET